MQKIVEGKRHCYQGMPLESLSSLKEENVHYDLEEKCQQVKNAIRKHEMEVQEQVRQHLVKQRNELFRDVDKFMETKRLEIQQVYRKDTFERNRFNTVENGKGNIGSKYGNCNGRKEFSVHIEYIRDDLDGLKLNSFCLGKLDHNFNSTRIPSTKTSAPVTSDLEDHSKAEHVSADEDEDSKEYINVKDATKPRAHLPRHHPMMNPRHGRRCASAGGQVTTPNAKICPRPDNYENLWESTGRNNPCGLPDKAPFYNDTKRNIHASKGLPCEPCVQSPRRADWEYVEIKGRHMPTFST